MTSTLMVPVIDVRNDNFNELWPAMVVAIKTSTFVALDTELSGLGNRKALLAEFIEDRYRAICHAARSRSIISLGIACYKKMDQKVPETYQVQLYNLTLLCSEEYTIEPQSVRFLVEHGFDFNKQCSHGIPYCKGNNKGGADYNAVNIRALFTELLRARKPLVLHNGLVDIAFLYQSFYAHLPERLATFTADLSEMFPAGIYDTKYITEFELRFAASYLEYAYKKCKLDNSRSIAAGAAGPHVYLDFCQFFGLMSAYVDYIPCSAAATSDAQTEVCQRFSAFGWCPKGTQCPLSHDTDLIIFEDEKNSHNKKKKRKRQKEKKSAGVADEDAVDGAPENKMPHMDVDPEEMSGVQQGPAAESCSPCMPQLEGGENSQTNEELEGKKTETEHTLSAATAVINNNTNTNIAVESRAGGPKERVSDVPAESNNQKKKEEAGTHRAGFDAFMTGYIFAYSCTLWKTEKAEQAAGQTENGEEEPWLPTCLNKVYLSGKTTALNVVKSTFTKSSKAHMLKMEMVWGAQK
ncbi:target of EGR1 protein 1 [Salarias fasciatus]|uniref:Target of EGR1 protein 1 n=1 Tax=Salarias fasciatus TaxID=181472 RepID=A0A672HIE6_SALFA|nr:target of EGR1 protein 1 [Salarias fasciatus]